MRAIAVGAAMMLLVSGFAFGDKIDPRAKAVMDKAEKAAKAREAKQFATYYEESEYFMYNDEGVVSGRGQQKSFSKGNKSRSSTIEYDTQKPGNMVQSEMHLVFDGADGWIITSDGKRKINDDQTKKYLDQMHEKAVQAMPVEEKQDDKKVQEQPKNEAYADYLGTEKVSGILCHIVEAGSIENGKKDPMCKSWVADDTGEMLKGEFAGMRFEQGDLRTIKGTRMAFTQTTYLNGKKSRMSTVKDVRINEPVEDSVFNPDLITVAKGTGKPAAMAAWFHPLDDLKGAQETSNEEQRQTGDIKLPEPAAPQQETREDTSFKKEVKNELKKEAGKQLIKGFLGAVLK